TGIDLPRSLPSLLENLGLVQTPGSGISILLAVGTPSTGSGNLYCQWELSPSSGNALCILFPTHLFNSFIIAVQTPGSGISILLAVGKPSTGNEFEAVEEREVSCEDQQRRSGVKRKLFGSCKKNIEYKMELLARLYVHEAVARHEVHVSSIPDRDGMYIEVLERDVEVVRNASSYEGKLAQRYVGPFEILERIGPVAYWLRLREELSGIHDTFHVSNLKQCLTDASLHVPLDEIKVDKTICFVEEPVEIMNHEVKSLKQSRILLVKVRWNSKRGPEFTWDSEDFMKSKYP
nr:putative reverse transcriptase domain-containing protein [Tanacetum cinerariifolium]